MTIYNCKRCGNKKFYSIRRGKKRCKNCGYEFTPWLVSGIYLSIKTWKKIIYWFLLEKAGWWIAK